MAVDAYARELRSRAIRCIESDRTSFIVGRLPLHRNLSACGKAWCGRCQAGSPPSCDRLSCSGSPRESLASPTPASGMIGGVKRVRRGLALYPTADAIASRSDRRLAECGSSASSADRADVKIGPEFTATMCWMQCSSCRTFPGHGRTSRACIASRRHHVSASIALEESGRQDPGYLPSGCEVEADGA